MRKKYFVAGTDTDAGKTLVTAAILHKASLKGKATLGLKPVSAGCEQTEDGLRNADALALMEHSSVKLSYDEINPFAFEPPIAPHIAAKKDNKTLSSDRIVAMCRGAMMNRYDLLLIEGAGGWRVPLSHRETLAEVPKALQMDVILVVGMKLGCISHALLTVESVYRDQLKIAGWVANRMDPEMACYDENLDTLKAMIPAPCLGEIPWLEDPGVENAAKFVEIDVLVE